LAVGLHKNNEKFKYPADAKSLAGKQNSK